jgi:Rrf2 family transcriptional regulator, repressor of oqxAB
MHMASSRNCHTITPSAFGLAIQALVFLSLSENVCPSQKIAKMMKSGTTFMRRIMGPLVRANLVEAREGRDGGYLLAKPAHVITVADVYRALQMNDPLGAGLLDSTADCVHGESIRRLFSEMTTRAEKSVLEVYEQYTIEQIAAQALGN